MIKYYKWGNSFLMENIETDELWWRNLESNNNWVLQAVKAKEFRYIVSYKYYIPITEEELMLELL